MGIVSAFAEINVMSMAGSAVVTACTRVVVLLRPAHPTVAGTIFGSRGSCSSPCRMSCRVSVCFAEVR